MAARSKLLEEIHAKSIKIPHLILGKFCENELNVLPTPLEINSNYAKALRTQLKSIESKSIKILPHPWEINEIP